MRAAVLYLCLPVAALSQGRATIYGAVTDPAGAAIPNATVSAQNEGVDQTRQTVSGADGTYLIPDLPVGIYRVSAQALGFKTFTEPGIQLQVDENRRVAVRMALGEVSENVTVAAEVVQVETRTSALKEVIDSPRIVELPLNGRNPLQLQYLVAGSGRITAPGQEENASVAINGARPNLSNYTLDGADNQDPFFNTPSVFPNPDALDEFSLQTSAYGADLGRNAGAVMNAVTKSGSNQFHGTAFEFIRNQDFDARSFFAKTVSPFKRHQYGGTLGGPILRDKTFFFGSYQGTRVNSSPGTQNPLVPTPAQRAGIFSTTLKNPSGGTFGTTIPQSQISQASVNFLNAFVPLPNTPDGHYTFPSEERTTDDQAVGRVDHHISDKDQLSGRFLFERNNDNQVVNATTLPGFLALINYRNWNVSVTDTYTLSARAVNLFTFGYNDITREQLPQIPQQKTWGDFGAGIIRAAPGPIAYDTEIPNFFFAQSRYQLNQYRKGIQYSDALTWILGAHSLKLGGDMRQSMVDQSQNFQTDPRLVFTANFTGNALADFLIGRPNQYIQNSPNAGRPRTIEPDAFVQDDWKLSRNFTLNVGMRYDPFLPFHDLNHALSQVRLGQQSRVFPTAPRGYVFPGDAGVPATTVPARLANFAPRLGFAWDVFGNGRTSLRSGYGVFYSDIRQQALNNLSSNEPFAISLNVAQPSGGVANPYSDTGNPFPFQPPTTQQERQNFRFFLPLTTITEFDPDFRDARVQQWNFTLQQQLFSSWVLQAAYVGSVADHLFIQNELNPSIFGRPGNANARRLLAPNYTSITDMLSIGNSSYNAVQLSANRRFHNGFTVLVNYTWSKSIDDGSADGFQASNPFNIRADKAVSDFDIPHRFVTSFIWQIPAFRNGKSLADQALGGWEINGIFTVQSGTPFTVTSGVDNSASGINMDRANVIGNPYLSSSRSKADKIAQYFNINAFALNTPGTFGNAGRNLLRGAGSTNLDFGLIKTFTLYERLRFQFRAEAFNALNHTNLNNPNANRSAANFGQISGSAAPRVLQLAGKIVF